MDAVAVEALIPIVAILVGGFLIFSRTRLGHALADGLSGRGAGAPALEAELRALRAAARGARARPQAPRWGGRGGADGHRKAPPPGRAAVPRGCPRRRPEGGL